MQRQGIGSANLALAARAEERINRQSLPQWDEDTAEKKTDSSCKAERAIHFIPLLLLGCLLLLYAFSYPPIQDSFHAKTKEIKFGIKGSETFGPQKPISSLRKDSVKSSSVYTQRSSNQTQKHAKEDGNLVHSNVKQIGFKRSLNGNRKLRIPPTISTY
eukprot:Gb_10672 [translate_table: standard]